MNSSGDSGAAIKHLFNANVSDISNVNYQREITSGEIQDKLRNELSSYSENNPEPPAMKE